MSGGEMRVGAAQNALTSLVGEPSTPAERTWGGPRRGAGRPRKADKDRTFVAHRVRAAHEMRYPTHVTLHAREGIPDLRTDRVREMLREILELQRDNPRYGDRFQVVHYSLRADHLHLVVEASDNRAMRSGVSGLNIAFAMRLNGILGRPNGKVWLDRYHSRELRTPGDVRRALAHVLRNDVPVPRAPRTWLLGAYGRAYAA